MNGEFRFRHNLSENYRARNGCISACVSLRRGWLRRNPPSLPPAARLNSRHGLPRPARTLKSPDDLIAAGLVAPWRRGELAAVAARYAIALTPAVAELIEKGDPATRSRGNIFPTSANSSAIRPSIPIRSATR